MEETKKKFAEVINAIEVKLLRAEELIRKEATLDKRELSLRDLETSLNARNQAQVKKENELIEREDYCVTEAERLQKWAEALARQKDMVKIDLNKMEELDKRESAIEERERKFEAGKILNDNEIAGKLKDIKSREDKINAEKIIAGKRTEELTLKEAELTRKGERLQKLAETYNLSKGQVI